MKLCPGCTINPETGRCQYGGPFHLEPAKEPDLKAYIGETYGDYLPAKMINGKWVSQYAPFGPRFENWGEYARHLTERNSP